MEGTVIEIASSGNDLPNPIYRLKVRIDKSIDIEGYPNFLKGKDGQDIVFLIKDIEVKGLINKKIRAVVEYRGDEHRGSFWIKSFRILNSI